jgi:hypothetical protein
MFVNVLELHQSMINDINKRVLIWHFPLVLIKINYGQIGDQTALLYNKPSKLVFCAKYDRGLNLGFWEILKPLK